MWTLAQMAYLDSPFDSDTELPHAGCALENPWVFDESAREIKALAEKGLVQIVREHARALGDQVLIDQLVFRRLHSPAIWGVRASRSHEVRRDRCV